MVIGTQSLYKDILLKLLNEVEVILNDVGHSGPQFCDAQHVNGAAGHLVATSGHPHKKMLAPLGAIPETSSACSSCPTEVAAPHR